MLDYSYENAAHLKGYKIVCGVDEAGRGPLAGPVFAAAVVLPENYSHPVLNDSKKLSEKKRDEVFDDIVRDAVCYGVGTASEKEIDEILRERSEKELSQTEREALIKTIKECAAAEAEKRKGG